MGTSNGGAQTVILRTTYVILSEAKDLAPRSRLRTLRQIMTPELAEFECKPRRIICQIYQLLTKLVTCRRQPAKSPPTPLP